MMVQRPQRNECIDIVIWIWLDPDMPFVEPLIRRIIGLISLRGSPSLAASLNKLQFLHLFTPSITSYR